MTFEEDLKLWLYNSFSCYGIKIPFKARLYDMLLDYLTIHKKVIVNKRREVIISPVLQEKIDLHPKLKEILHLRALFEQGKEVNFFQSKRLFQSQFHDHLLYEWGIYHFHLSLDREKKSNFQKQTDLLLFAYIDEGRTIFLDTEKHKEGIFAHTRWLEILSDQYPDILDPYFESSITEISPKLGSVELQRMWDYGYTMGWTKVRNKVFRNKGVGRSTSGHSLIIVKTTGALIRWIHYVSEAFETKRQIICNAFDLSEETSRFKMRIGSQTLEVFEINTGKVVHTFPERYDFKVDENPPA